MPNSISTRLLQSCLPSLFLVVLSTGFNLHFQERASGQEPSHVLSGHERCVFRIIIGPDGKQLISATAHDVKMWDLVRHKVIATHKIADMDALTDIAYSAKNQIVVASYVSGTLATWDIASGKRLRIWSAYAKGGSVHQVSLLPDQQTIVSLGNAGGVMPVDELVFWDTKTGTEKRRIACEGGLALCFSVSADGQLIYSGGENADGKGVVKCWDAITGKAKWGIPINRSGPISTIALVPDGSRMIIGSFSNESIAIIDLLKNKEVAFVKAHTDGTDSIILSPDGKYIVTSSARDGMIKIWDSNTLMNIWTHQRDRFLIVKVGFSADGKRLFAGTEKKDSSSDGDRPIYIWDWEQIEKKIKRMP